MEQKPTPHTGAGEFLPSAAAGWSDPYLQLFASSPIPMFVYDFATLRFLDVNEAAVNMYGWSREEFLRMTIEQIRPAEDLPAFRAVLAATGPRLQESSPWRHLHRDGTLLDVLVRSHAITFDGRPARLVGITNISEQQRAQRILKDEHDILELIARDAPLPQILHDIVRFVEVGPGSMRCSVLLAEADRLRVAAAPSLPAEYNAAVDIPIGPDQGSCGTAAFQRQRVMVADTFTDPKWAAAQDLVRKYNLRSCTSEPIFSARGDVIGTFALYSDLAAVPNEAQLLLLDTAAHLASIAIDRAREQERLKQSEEHFRVVADAAPLMMWATSPTGGPTYYNLQWYTYTGLPRDARTREQIFSVVHPADRPALEARWVETDTQSEPYELQMRIRRADGVYRWHLSRTCPVLDENGRVLRWVGTVVDIDEQRQLQEQTRQAADVAQAANNAKDRFLAALSHELRTPLAPVLASLSSLLSWSELPPNVHGELKMIRRNVELEARLIDDLLDLTRITRGKLQLHRQRVEIHQLLRDVLEICAAEVQARRQTLVVAFQPGEVWVDGDSARLQQVFWNLIKNAVKFTPEDGTIHVRTSAEGSQLTVEVSDTGRGIAPEKIGVIFNAFEQADPQVTREFGGLGLGLAISQAIMRMHGGSLEAKSAGVGKGAQFRAHLALEHGAALTPAQPVVPALTQRRLRILLVEDHVDTANVMVRLLKALGHQVTLATSVAGAIRIGKAEPFEVLLSDIGLPDGSGTEVVQALAAAGPIKAVALSGFGMEADIARSKAAGFLEHLVKPVDLERLQTVLASVSKI